MSMFEDMNAAKGFKSGMLGWIIESINIGHRMEMYNSYLLEVSLNLVGPVKGIDYDRAQIEFETCDVDGANRLSGAFRAISGGVKTLGQLGCPDGLLLIWSERPDKW